MTHTRFQFITIGFVVVLVAIGVFAVRALTQPATYTMTNPDLIGDMQTRDEVTDDTIVATTGTQGEVPARNDEQVAGGDATPETPATTDTSLSARLSTVKAKNVIYKVGSKGGDVSVIQEFLNAYDKKSTKTDGDYGQGTADRVKAFQKASGVTQTGQTAQQTLTKMIEWAEKNG